MYIKWSSDCLAVISFSKGELGLPMVCKFPCVVSWSYLFWFSQVFLFYGSRYKIVILQTSELPALAGGFISFLDLLLISTYISREIVILLKLYWNDIYYFKMYIYFFLWFCSLPQFTSHCSWAVAPSLHNPRHSYRCQQTLELNILMLLIYFSASCT